MKNFLKLISYSKEYLSLYIPAFVCVITSQIVIASVPALTGILIDCAVLGKGMPNNFMSAFILLFGKIEKGIYGIIFVSVFIFLFTALRYILMYLKLIFANLASEGAVKKLRNKMYNHIQYLPFSFHVKTDTGDLIQRCTSDIETIRQALSSWIVDGVSIIFLACFIISMMMKENFMIALLSCIILPISLIMSALFFRYLQKQFKTAAEAEAKMTSAIQENLTGVRVVKAFRRQEYEKEKFDKLSSEYRSCNLKITNAFAIFWAVSDSFSFAQICFITLYGSYLAYNGIITIGTLTVFTSYITMLVFPIRSLGRIISNLGKACVSAERIEKILNEETEDLFPSGIKPEIKGNIVFDNVSFSYSEEQKTKTLNCVSFEVKEGQTIGIIGATGSGKSSLVHLLDRLYEYSSGSITVDGIELNKIDKGWIRSNIGIVLQEPFLYARSVAENIRLAAPSASMEEVIKYSKISALHKDIEDFKNKYETLVGEQGVSLSGGQRQRLAIARALIKKPAILIFDDSLSAVDTNTDTEIRNALKYEKGKRTVIIISHRISSISEADKIIVLDKGKIIQSGTHNSLLKEDGVYKRIFEIQNSFNEDENE